MIKILDGASKKAIAIEIVDGYGINDEKLLEEIFDEKLASGISKVNILIVVNKMNFTHISWKALWDDGVYALKHMRNCGRIAIVGDNKVEEFLIKNDNIFYETEKKGRAEKYFEVADIDKAMGWINE